MILQEADDASVDVERLRYDYAFIFFYFMMPSPAVHAVFFAAAVIILPPDMPDIDTLRLSHCR